MINLRQVEVFYTIMRAGSVTEAARVLNVTQPAVSAALKQLEARLGMKLFERVGGRLHPTAEARGLMPDVAEIFGRLGAVERLSQDLARGARGALSVAATPPLADGYVAKAVAALLAKRPGVRVNLQAIPSAAVLDRVINREIDVGVVYEPVVSSAVRVEELSRTAIGCILSSRHPLARRKSVRAQDLAGQRLVTYLPQALLRPYIDRAVGAHAAALEFPVQVGASATAIMLAVHGAGIALVETALFSARPIAGFVMRPLEPRVELSVLLLRARQGGPSALVDEFIVRLRAVLP